MAGVNINELPKYLAENPDKKTHAIIFSDLLNPNQPLTIPLLLKGVRSYFPSRKPRASEYEYESISHINITSEAPVWEPSEAILSEQEDVMTDFRGQVIIHETISRGQRIINSLSSSDEDAVYFTNDNNFFSALIDKVNVARLGLPKLKHGITSQPLSHKLLISPEAAKRTVQYTTQRGIRTILHTSLPRRFKTNDQDLMYNRLQHNILTYTMQVGTISRRMNRYYQVYSTEFGCSRVHPMK